MDRSKYLMAKINGKLDKFRSDEISRRISAKYSFNDQIAILMDKDVKPDEWNAYQEFRAKVKADIDGEISAFERES